MGLITLAALFSAGLTVWSLTATTMMERRGEVAIMQAIGATRGLVAALFGLEIAMVGLVGGVIGAFGGVFLAHHVGAAVFGAFRRPRGPGFVDPAFSDRVRSGGNHALAGAAQPLAPDSANGTRRDPSRRRLSPDVLPLRFSILSSARCSTADKDFCSLSPLLRSRRPSLPCCLESTAQSSGVCAMSSAAMGQTSRRSR